VRAQALPKAGSLELVHLVLPAGARLPAHVAPGHHPQRRRGCLCGAPLTPFEGIPMHLVRQREGQRIQVLRDQVTIKVASARSPFGQTIVSVEVPPRGGTPCVTDAKEEVYHLLEVEFLMHTPDEKHTLQPGDMVHLPPLAPHGYRNSGDKPARFLAWTIGGPLNRFFETMAERVHQLPQDLPAMHESLAASGVEPVGAPR
jgi:quercetin dioxygenase-like cupin family protein